MYKDVLIVLFFSFSAEFSPLNLDRIQTWIDEGRLDTSKPITLKELNDSRCLHGVKADGVKLLARVRMKALKPSRLLLNHYDLQDQGNNP